MQQRNRIGCLVWLNLFTNFAPDMGKYVHTHGNKSRGTALSVGKPDISLPEFFALYASVINIILPPPPSLFNII